MRDERGNRYFMLVFIVCVYFGVHCSVLKQQEYGHHFKYGYVSHTNQRGLYKLSLPAMKYVKAIDLAPYNCVPRSLQFSSLRKLLYNPST